MSKIWVPHNYQRQAVGFILPNPMSGLFLDPGLGKTTISLASMKILKNADEIKGVLLVAPLRVCYSTWPNEIEKWENFKNTSYTILHGDAKETLWGPKKDLYLINPEGLKWLYRELLVGLRNGKKCPFDTLWIDESTKFKNHESERFKMAADMMPLFNRRHIMTGTPAPKSLLDLWSQIYILDGGKALTNNYNHYRNKYFQANDWNKYSWNIKDFCEDAIHQAVAPLVLEMSAKDHLDMPDLIYNDIPVILPAGAMRHYKRMEKEFFLEIDGLEASAEAQAQASMKCHQVANGRVYEDIPDDLTDEEERAFRRNRKEIQVHRAKLEALRDLLDELNGKPLLIAYHFKHDLAALKELLGKDLPYIGSGVSPKRAKELERLWNAGELPFLAGHPDSMGHGLNFQESGNDICWFSLTWNLENYIQFIARIYRQGVTGKVRVHHLIAENTVDEAMLLRLGERAEEQRSLREALKQYRLRAA